MQCGFVTAVGHGPTHLLSLGSASTSQGSQVIVVLPGPAELYPEARGLRGEGPRSSGNLNHAPRLICHVAGYLTDLGRVRRRNLTFGKLELRITCAGGVVVKVVCLSKSASPDVSEPIRYRCCRFSARRCCWMEIATDARIQNGILVGTTAAWV